MQKNINVSKATENILDSIRQNPYDSRLRNAFNELFVLFKEKDPRFHEVSCKLNYLNDSNNYNYLNDLGDYYLNSKNSFLSLMCYLESLRINPKQVEIFSILQSIENSCKPLNLGYFHDPENMVSVIMATYKRNRTIKESIQSVLNQTVKDIELIVINDGEENDEHTRQIVMEFNSPRIKYYKLDSNSGHAKAMNEGIRRARGKYIAYLDDDDIYYPMHLETLLNAVEKSECKIAYANTKMIYGHEQNTYFTPTKVRLIWDVDFNKDRLIRDNYISNLSIIHDRELLYETGGFWEDLRVVMDWEMWLRMSLNHNFLHVRQTTGEYRLRDDNITIKDRLRIDIHTRLIRNYYSYYRGLVAYTKFNIYNKMESNALRLYEEIVKLHTNYFKTIDACKELIDISSSLKDRHHGNAFLMDYLFLAGKDCLKYIYSEKSVRMLQAVIPMLPQKILSALRRTAQRLWIERTRNGDVWT